MTTQNPRPVVVALPGNSDLAAFLAGPCGADEASLLLRQFPDGESYLRLETDVEGRDVVVACTLDQPDFKALQLFFAARLCREMGARRVGLVCPYLSYMRQDARFQAGEAITSRYFAALVSEHFDWLVTVDPHLHRYDSLDEIYTIPSRVVHAAPSIADWLPGELADGVLIGPDEESVQWVADVAERAGLPYVVLEKVRRGDRDVEIVGEGLEQWRERTPILLDDIISTARTMVETIGHLKSLDLRPPVCIGIHAVFANGAIDELYEAGASRVVTCNTILHPSNAIDVLPLVGEAAAEMARGG